MMTMAKKKTKIAYLNERGTGLGSAYVAVVTVCNQKLSRPKQPINADCRVKTSLPDPKWDCACTSPLIHTIEPRGGGILGGFVDVDRYRILGGGGGGGFVYDWYMGDSCGCIDVVLNGEAEVDVLEDHFSLMLLDADGNIVEIPEGDADDYSIAIDISCDGTGGYVFSVILHRDDWGFSGRELTAATISNGFSYNLIPSFSLPTTYNSDVELLFGFIDIAADGGTHTNLTLTLTIDGITHQWTNINAVVPTCLSPTLNGQVLGEYFTLSPTLHGQTETGTLIVLTVQSGMCGANPTGTIDQACLFLPSQGGCFSAQTLPITIDETTSGQLTFEIPGFVENTVLLSNGLFIHTSEPTDCVFSWLFDLDLPPFSET